MIIVKLYFI